MVPLVLSPIQITLFPLRERASAGLECVSMKTPSTPVATAARARPEKPATTMTWFDASLLWVVDYSKKSLW